MRTLRLAGAVLALSATALGSSSCAGGPVPPRRADPPLVARTEPTAPGTSVLSGAPDVVAAGVARTLFSFAPVVVVADAGRPAEISAGAAQAERAHAPLLLARGGTVGTATLAEIASLHPRAVLAVGVGRNALAAQLRATHPAPPGGPVQPRCRRRGPFLRSATWWSWRTREPPRPRRRRSSPRRWRAAR